MQVCWSSICRLQCGRPRRFERAFEGVELTSFSVGVERGGRCLVAKRILQMLQHPSEAKSIPRKPDSLSGRYPPRLWRPRRLATLHPKSIKHQPIQPTNSRPTAADAAPLALGLERKLAQSSSKGHYPNRSPGFEDGWTPLLAAAASGLYCYE